MSGFLASPAASVVAVLLAALGAVVFGLASVRQHGAVQTTVGEAERRGAGRWHSVVALLRDRSWLIGVLQSGVGGGLHVLALALAPITLVQPIGVLAVPTTVVAASVEAHRRPPRAQLVGTVLSVVGIVVVTLCLLVPATRAGAVPAAGLLAATVGSMVALAVIVVLNARRLGPRVRSVALALTAAMLFGLNSVLIRTIGEVVTRNLLGTALPTALVAAVGLAAALPLGVLAMQSSYRSGSAQVVICCLTLMDPITAVAGGRLLLRDGDGLSGLILVGVAVGAVLATVGVVLMSRDFPGERPASQDESLHLPAS